MLLFHLIIQSFSYSIPISSLLASTNGPILKTSTQRFVSCLNTVSFEKVIENFFIEFYE